MSAAAARLARGAAGGGVLLLAGLLAALLLSPAEAGSTYRYEDETGVVHYTNVPADPRYHLFRADPELASAPAKPGPAARGGLAGLADAIHAAAERYGVDQRLIAAVVRVESGGDPGAVSPKGAQGLMQLMPQRAAALGVRNPFNPLQNLDGGVRHLRDLLQQFAGNLTLALAAYNAGEAAVRAYRGVPPFPETESYVRKVRALYDGSGDALLGGAGAETPQRIYREVAEDGTIVFTNVPPTPSLTLQQRF